VVTRDATPIKAVVPGDSPVREILDSRCPDAAVEVLAGTVVSEAEGARTPSISSIPLSIFAEQQGLEGFVPLLFPVPKRHTVTPSGCLYGQLSLEIPMASPDMTNFPFNLPRAL
jgi:hypothetical protein